MDYNLTKAGYGGDGKIDISLKLLKNPWNSFCCLKNILC
jgi:hypothetical protein